MKKNYFIAENAYIYGDVTLGEDVNIWFNVSIRADYESVVIGNRSNVQDNAVIHVDFGHKTIIKDDVTIGHSAIVHGCQIDNNVIVGMGATILNGAHIGENSIIGANSLVTQNKKFPPNSLIMGSPAKVVRELTETEIKSITINAANYVKNSKDYQNNIYKRLT